VGLIPWSREKSPVNRGSSVFQPAAYISGLNAANLEGRVAGKVETLGWVPKYTLHVNWTLSAPKLRIKDICKMQYKWRECMHVEDVTSVIGRERMLRISLLCVILVAVMSLLVDRDSAVGNENRYGLNGPGSSPDGAMISAPVKTDPGAHPASYTISAGFFSGGEAARDWHWPPTPSSAEVKQRYTLYTSTRPRGLCWLL
jgi:hypothetical protein